jgi:nucleoside-diphosphate-sugar epimerase
MRLDLSVNLLTFQALKNSKITVFGGDQVRPNIHVDDLSAVYRHILSGKAPEGIYNAGFENIAIIEMARTIADRTGAEIVVSESNDPRSYRQSSAKILYTGFNPAKSVLHAVEELVAAFHKGELTDRDEWYTVKSMTAKGLA